MASQFRNPVLSGFFPDPSCVLVDGTFYLVNSTFQFFPAISLHISTDLVHWTAIASVITRPGLVDLSDSKVEGCHAVGLLAPSIRYHESTFYVVCTNLNSKFWPQNFMVTSSDPLSGHWSDPIWMEFGGIDPSLFFDDDGKAYFQGAQAIVTDPAKPFTADIVQMEIDVKTGKSLSGAPRQLWTGFTGGHFPEGPHLYKKDGWYYLLLAEGGTEVNHCVTMARSRSPWGPFTGHPHNPVLTNRGSDEYIQAVGHADLLRDDQGLWWALCLGVRVKEGSFPLGRQTFLCPIDWPEGHWPQFNSGLPLRQHMNLDRTLPGPALTQEQSRPRALPELRPTCPELLFLRNPKLSNYKWLADGKVILLGEPSHLSSDLGTSTFLGFRQRDICAEVSVIIDFQPGKDEAAGSAVYVDTHRHMELSICGRGDGIGRVLRSRTTCLKPGLSEDQEVTLPVVGPIRIRMRSDQRTYYFEYQTQETTLANTWIPVCSVPSSQLSEWGFTGALFALFATSNRRADPTPAVFSDLRYFGHDD